MVASSVAVIDVLMADLMDISRVPRKAVQMAWMMVDVTAVCWALMWVENWVVKMADLKVVELACQMADWTASLVAMVVDWVVPWAARWVLTETDMWAASTVAK